jgi:hypothetical protein
VLAAAHNIVVVLVMFGSVSGKGLPITLGNRQQSNLL